MAKKGTKGAIPEAALQIVEDLLARCIPHGDIEKQLSQAPPSGLGVTDRTIRKYIGIVYKRWQAGARVTLTDERRAIEYERAVKGIEAIVSEAMGRGDLKTALRAHDRRAHLLGLYPAQRVELGGIGGSPLSATPSEIADEIAARLRKRAKKSDGEGGPAAPATP